MKFSSICATFVRSDPTSKKDSTPTTKYSSDPSDQALIVLDTAMNSELKEILKHTDTVLFAEPTTIPKNISPDRSAIQLLHKEFQQFLLKPLEKITFAYRDSNICNWYFLIHGYEQTPFSNGLFIGAIFFPPNYPYKAPEIQMISPTGRFQIRKALCLSMTAHHEESWNPAWSIEKIFMGFVSYMNLEEYGSGCFLPDKYNDKFKEEISKNSKDWLYRNCKVFEQLFPNEYSLLEIAKNETEDILGYVLRQSLQNKTRFDNVTRRVLYYSQNKDAINIQLEDQKGAHEDILTKYFSSVISKADINRLGVELLEEIPVVYVSDDSDDEEEDEIELYSENELELSSEDELSVFKLM